MTNQSTVKLYNNDCLQILKTIKDKSIDLVLIDPPYNISKADWDTWKTVEDYVNFMGEVFKECQRVLKGSGSLYWFHSDINQVKDLMTYLDKHTEFSFRSFIIWKKPKFRKFIWNNPGELNHLRSWFNICEYILFYTLQKKTGSFKVNSETHDFYPLMKYFMDLQLWIGVSKKDLIENIGHCVSHCFRQTGSQWSLLTEETYNKLIEKYSIDTWEKFRTYKSLKEEYESFRYTYNIAPLHNNVWTSEYVNTAKNHPTEKPVDILERIIKCSSNEGDVILDCFMGSGSTGVAAVNLKRNFIGIERDSKYFSIAENRIEEKMTNAESHDLSTVQAVK